MNVGFNNVKLKSLIQQRVPIVKWLPQYTYSLLLQDFLAGITVGMTEIPQAIAYAAIAGLPPEYGLYSGLADGFIYAIFGGSKDVNIGPSSILALMIQPIVANFGYNANCLITFFSGVVIFVLGILHLGFLINFFSYPVLTGFIASGGVVIFSTQFKNMLGISGSSDTVVETWTTIVTNFGQFSKWDFTLGASSLLFLIFFRLIKVFGTLENRPDWSKSRNFFGRTIFFLSSAASALVLIIGTALSYFLQNEKPFKITGNVKGSFPKVQSPPFSIFPNLINLTFVLVPLLSILEATVTAKAFNKGRKVDATQEMIASGLCNIVGSFIGSMPVTASFSRSAVNSASGVRTPLGGIFTSLLLLLVIAFLTPTFYYVPKASLAAILICAVLFLVDYQAVPLLWKSKKLDLIPLFTTLLVGVFVSIEYGIVIGAAVNLLFILYASARPKFDIRQEKGENEVYVITPRDTLLYPGAELLRDTAVGYEGRDVTVILNGKYIRSMDFTVAKCLVALTQELKLKDHKVFLLDFKKSIAETCLRIDQSLKDLFFNEESYKNMIKSRTTDDQELSIINTL